MQNFPTRSQQMPGCAPANWGLARASVRRENMRELSATASETLGIDRHPVTPKESADDR